MRGKEPKDEEDPKTQQYAPPSRHTHRLTATAKQSTPAPWRLVENVTVGFSKGSGLRPFPQLQRQYLFPPSHISHLPSSVSVN